VADAEAVVELVAEAMKDPVEGDEPEELAATIVTPEGSGRPSLELVRYNNSAVEGRQTHPSRLRCAAGVCHTSHRVCANFSPETAEKSFSGSYRGRIP